MVKALCLLLLSAFIFNLSQANNNLATPVPKPENSFTLTYIQNEATCSYWVAINTSCASSIFTRDKISLAFGDVSGNQIYAPSLDGPEESTFKPCSTDVFEIEGPCAKEICSGYLYKSGPDKWIPESVKIYGGYNTEAATFYYNTTIPDKVWYGYSLCQYTSPPPPFPFHPPPPSSSYRRFAPAGWFVLIITGLVSAL